MEHKLTLKRWLILVGCLLLLLNLPCQAQKTTHQNNLIPFLSVQSRDMLNILVDQGWLSRTGNGNKYYVYLIDSCFYENVGFEQLDIDTPLRGGSNLWAFRDSLAVEPFLFYVTYLEIKFVAGTKRITQEQLPPMSNIENTDLESFFGNGKVWKSKAHRKQKLKEKKAKK